MVSHWWVTPFVAIYLMHLKYVPHSKDLDEVMALLSKVSKFYMSKCPDLSTQLVLLSRLLTGLYLAIVEQAIT